VWSVLVANADWIDVDKHRLLAMADHDRLVFGTPIVVKNQAERKDR